MRILLLILSVVGAALYYPALAQTAPSVDPAKCVAIRFEEIVQDGSNDLDVALTNNCGKDITAFTLSFWNSSTSQQTPFFELSKELIERLVMRPAPPRDRFDAYDILRSFGVMHYRISRADLNSRLVDHISVTTAVLGDRTYAGSIDRFEQSMADRRSVIDGYQKVVIAADGASLYDRAVQEFAVEIARTDPPQIPIQSPSDAIYLRFRDNAGRFLRTANADQWRNYVWGERTEALRRIGLYAQHATLERDAARIDLSKCVSIRFEGIIPDGSADLDFSLTNNCGTDVTAFTIGIWKSPRGGRWPDSRYSTDLVGHLQKTYVVDAPPSDVYEKRDIFRASSTIRVRARNPEGVGMFSGKASVVAAILFDGRVVGDFAEVSSWAGGRLQSLSGYQRAHRLVLDAETPQTASALAKERCAGLSPNGVLYRNPSDAALAQYCTQIVNFARIEKPPLTWQEFRARKLEELTNKIGVYERHSRIIAIQ